MTHEQLTEHLLEHFRNAYDDVMPMRPPRGLTNADVNRAMIAALTQLAVEVIDAVASANMPTARSDLARYIADEVRLKSARMESLGNA